MESTNLHHLQDQPPPLNTSSLSTPSCYGIGSTPSWSPEISLNAGNRNQILQEAGSRSRDLKQKKDIGVAMTRDLGYHNQWASEAESCLSSTQAHSSHDLDLHFSIKKEDMCHNFPRFTDMPSNNSMEQHYELQRDHLNGLREKLLLNTLSSSDFYYNSTSFDGGLGAPSRGNFSQIYPTINISNLNNSSSTISSSSNINMHSSYESYPISSATLSGHSSLSLHMQHSSHPPQFANGMVEPKRPSALMESKPSNSQTASKKSRPEPRSSCPPLKVRKEKLGDRIAALQQLVAPFGKTDTASVLMEAIGYIKFLQNQVETLSVPYMKSSRNQNNNRSVIQGGSGKNGAGETPEKRDLRSRGLCLVPLACMSYLTADHPPPSMWHPPN